MKALDDSVGVHKLLFLASPEDEEVSRPIHSLQLFVLTGEKLGDLVQIFFIFNPKYLGKISPGTAYFSDGWQLPTNQEIHFKVSQVSGCLRCCLWLPSVTFFQPTESLELQDLRKAVEEQVGAEAGFLENPGPNKVFFPEMSI